MSYNLVAVKVIRPVAKYIKEAQDEVEVMRQLDTPFVPKCLEAKHWRDRFLVVTPAYGPNLYDILQQRDYRPMSTRLSILYVEQTLKALAHMHSKGFAHTDIKPENILIQSADNVKLGVKLIDMGGAVPLETINTATIQTRQYRAPEVVLGLPWSEQADIWSVGCTLAELVTGQVLFPAHDNRAHLAMIERCLGPFPEHMVIESSHFSEGAVKFPSMGMSEQTVFDVCSVQPLKQQFKPMLPVYAILRRMLAIDPADRYVAQELVDKIARWRAKGKLS
jgi:serine/threonine protein kinase